MTLLTVGGARCERKKWTLEISRTKAVLYTVNLGHYCEPFFENEKVMNRLEESILVFEDVLTRCLEARIYLIFSNYNNFNEYLFINPIETYYPSLNNKRNHKEIFKCIHEKFQNLNTKIRGQNSNNLITILTNAHDIEASSRLWKDLLAHESTGKVFTGTPTTVYSYLNELPKRYYFYWRQIFSMEKMRTKCDVIVECYK